MATSFVTLADLPGADPVATDNSATASENASATTSSGTATSPAGAELHAKVAELEGLIQRHRQQLHGSQAEVERLRQEMQTLRQSQTPGRSSEPAADPARPRTKLSEAVRKLELEDDPSLVEAWEQEVLHGGQGASALTRDDVQRIVQESQGRQTARQAVQQAIVQRHPELLSDQQFTQHVGARYQELVADPLVKTLYPDDPQFLFEEPTTGLQYDMRMLMQAANEVKAKTPPRQTPTLGITGGSGGTRPASGPAIPRTMVGQNGVFSDPRVQQALRTIGWGGNTRQQAEQMLKHLSPAARRQLEQG